MNFSILDAGTPEGLHTWLELWRSWPARDPMAHAEYARLFARPSDRTICVAGECAAGPILFPLLLRPIGVEPWARPGEARFDAISPYGFGGPFTWGSGSRDAAAFWRGFEEFCREQGVVSTFVRLSLFPEQLVEMRDPVEVRAANVVRSLEAGTEAIWNEYKHTVRSNIRLAREAGLKVEADPSGARLDDFYAVYLQTMERCDAHEWYRFPRSFFEQIIERLPGQFVFFHTLSQGKVVSTELVLHSREIAYSFLGGSLAEAFPLRPNDLLRHEIIEWAAKGGLKSYVLGGGYRPGDGVWRHKIIFAPKGEVPFNVACLVHDAAACQQLEADRAAYEARKGKAWTPRPDFFPSYRSWM